MFPPHCGKRSRQPRLPRVSGDVLSTTSADYRPTQSSPSKRGCPLLTEHVPALAAVFPIYAGMFLWQGDDAYHEQMSFPHTRGVPWSIDKVLANVGCFRGSVSWYTPHLAVCGASSLCTRDVPHPRHRSPAAVRSFPHTRGCSSRSPHMRDVPSCYRHSAHRCSRPCVGDVSSAHTGCLCADQRVFLGCSWLAPLASRARSSPYVQGIFSSHVYGRCFFGSMGS